MRNRTKRLHKQYEKLMAEREIASLPTIEFDAIISFRVPQVLKNTFFDICNKTLTTPRKYVTGNVLRQFVYCYIQDPLFFDNIFSTFENNQHKHSNADKF